jgi:hypothetical protein
MKLVMAVPVLVCALRLVRTMHKGGSVDARLGVLMLLTASLGYRIYQDTNDEREDEATMCVTLP